MATIITVIAGVALGMTGYAKIWPLFGAANQLLAALGLIAVATWLGKVGKNNKMFFIPMAFMLVVTIVSLIQTILVKVAAIQAGIDFGWNIVLVALAILLIILAIVLAIDGVKSLTAKKAK